MIRCSLWAGLVGSLSGGSAMLVAAVYDWISLGISPGGIPSDLPAFVLPFSFFLFPWCMAVGLLVTLLLWSTAERGTRRTQLAAVGLPAGALIMLALPMLVVLIAKGPTGVLDALSRPDEARFYLLLLTGATGAGSGAGAVIGLGRRRACSSETPRC